MDLTRITYSVEQRIATITLARPELQNALDDVMVSELIEAFSAAQKDAKCRAIILAADGESFSAGSDPAYLQRMSHYDLTQNQQDSSRLMHLFQQIYTIRKPVIALVQGPALAAGCALATVCDFVLGAAETATFGFTEVRSGFVPALIMVFLVRRIGEGRAREMTLRGNAVSAADAERLGLITASVPAIELHKAGRKLAQELAASNSGSSMGLVKELLARMHGMSTPDAQEYASNINALTRMTDDCKKGINAVLKQESIKW